MSSSWLLFSAHFACQLTSGCPHHLWSSISQIISWHCWTKISYQFICTSAHLYHSLQSGRMLALSNDITQPTALHPKHYLPIFSGSQIVQAPECSAPVNIWHGYHHESPSEVLYHLRQKILSYPKIWLWISDEAIADICTVIEGRRQCECLKPKVYTHIVVPNSHWIAKTSKNITHASVYCNSNSAGVTSPKHIRNSDQVIYSRCLF